MPSPFGLDAKTPQDVSDAVFNITRGNNGNSGRVPHLMMTFGQFLDHDFAYSLHQDACDNRYGINTDYSSVIDISKGELILSFNLCVVQFENDSSNLYNLMLLPKRQRTVIKVIKV